MFIYRMVLNTLGSLAFVDAFIAAMNIANGERTFGMFMWFIAFSALGFLACWGLVRD